MTRPPPARSKPSQQTGVTQAPAERGGGVREKAADAHLPALADDLRAEAQRRTSDLSFLLKDFEKTFDVYLYHLSERNEATRMFVTLASAPFTVFTIFGFASRADISKVAGLKPMLDFFPPILYILFIFFGAMGLIPFHRFVAAQSNGYKMIRYLNGYRLFYYQLIRDELNQLNWTSPIEKDPRIPKVKWFSFHWSNLFSYIMAITNSCFIALGLNYLDDWSSPWLFVTVAIIIGVLHWLMVKGELANADINRIEHDEKIPVDDLLSKTEYRASIEK